MIQAITKWKVQIAVPNGSVQTFWIFDNHLANVLRQIAAMQFSENGINQPASVVVTVAGEGQP